MNNTKNNVISIKEPTSSSTNLKNKRTKTSQVLLGIATLVIVIIIGALLWNISSKMGFFWITGISLGFVLQKSRFCFVASIRDPYLTGGTALTKAVLIAFAITTIAFTTIKFNAYSNKFPIPGQSYVVPISPATAIGAFMFGIGMVIAGGCSSSTLIRLGEGFLIQIITLFFFLVGALWGARDFVWWKLNFILKGKSIFLPDILGWFGAAIIQLLLIATLYILANKWGNRNGDI